MPEISLHVELIGSQHHKVKIKGTVGQWILLEMLLTKAPDSYNLPAPISGKAL